MPEDQITDAHAEDARLLRESGVHKLVIADHDGRCLAYLLAWDSFEYDPDTDSFVCVVEPDGRELMTIYTDGEVERELGTSRYVVTAPADRPASKTPPMPWDASGEMMLPTENCTSLYGSDNPPAAASSLGTVSWAVGREDLRA